MQEKRSGICVAGSLILDRFHEVETYPSEGFLSTVKETSFHIGGSGNLILDLAKLDKQLAVKVCAVVGKDDSGDKLLQTLQKYANINASDITREGESSVTLVINSQKTKQRTFFYIPGASDVFDEKCIPWKNVHSKIFHLEYLLLMKRVDAPDKQVGTHGAKILKIAKGNGMITSIDMVSEQSDRVRAVIRPALPYTDICCINEAEAEAVTGIEIAKDGEISQENALLALQALAKLGVAKWAVIHSPQKSYGYDVETGQFACVDSLTLPNGFIKGSTGAGDAFCSGILYGAHSAYSLEDAMKLAVACAACSLSENNGTDGMRALEEVRELYRRLSRM